MVISIKGRRKNWGIYKVWRWRELIVTVLNEPWWIIDVERICWSWVSEETLTSAIFRLEWPDPDEAQKVEPLRLKDRQYMCARINKTNKQSKQEEVKKKRNMMRNGYDR